MVVGIFLWKGDSVAFTPSDTAVVLVGSWRRGGGGGVIDRRSDAKPLFSAVNVSQCAGSVVDGRCSKDEILGRLEGRSIFIMDVWW